MSDSPTVQLVLPMAGSGQRFTDAGYRTPKPLLNIHGVPMFEIVLANLLSESIVSITIICQKAWGVRESIEQRTALLPQSVRIIELDHITDGPAATVNLARPYLDPELPLLVANSDQYVDADLSAFSRQLTNEKVSGLVLTMEDDDPKWSYAKVDSSDAISLIVEKSVISPYATVGIYGFKRARDCWTAFDDMAAAGDRVNGELYVGPSYNYLSRESGAVKCVHVGPIDSVMYGMGIPADYESFIATDCSRRAARQAVSHFDPPETQR